VPSAGVIETVDVFEDGDFNVSACFPRVPPDKLGLDGFEESLHRGIVIAISPAAHRGFEAVFA